MSTHIYDWSRFTCKVNINAPLQEIYDAWTVPFQMERWFLRKATFRRNDNSDREAMMHITEGDTYHWLWQGHADDVFEEGNVIHANGVDKLQFSFVKGATVTVDLGTAAGENIVLLTQENIPTDDFGKEHYHIDCVRGWTFYLANLKSFLEGGIDLRNTNALLPGMLNS